MWQPAIPVVTQSGPFENIGHVGGGMGQGVIGLLVAQVHWAFTHEQETPVQPSKVPQYWPA